MRCPMPRSSPCRRLSRPRGRWRAPDEIVAFAQAWTRPTPLVIVPTAYPQLTEATIAALGTIRLVIYANHGLRATVTALRDIFQSIRRDGGIQNIDGRIAPVEAI